MTAFTRKEFLKATLAAGGAALLARTRATAAPDRPPAIGRSGSASGDIRVACVGINQQGH